MFSHDIIKKEMIWRKCMKTYEIKSVIIGFALLLYSINDDSILKLLGILFIVAAVLPKYDKEK